MNPNNDSDIQSPSYGLSSVRIMTLADGVFAIVLTLLVLDIKAPKAISEAELISKLLALWPKLFSYIISFVILGILWFGHHMEFHYIRRSDRIHIWLNLLFLMCIAFIPFSAALLGSNLLRWELRRMIVRFGLGRCDRSDCNSRNTAEGE